MTPNVSILLQRWGVADVIGDNLVQFPDLNMRRKDGTTRIYRLWRRIWGARGGWFIGRIYMTGLRWWLRGWGRRYFSIRRL